MGFDQSKFDQLLADFIHSQKQQVRNLLKINGVLVPMSMSNRDVDIAFLTAIRDSPNFRSQVATALESHYKTKTSDFVDNSQYLNAVDAEPWLGGTTTTTTTAPTPTPKKTSFFGSIFTPELVSTGIKTGLDTLSTTTKAKADAASQQNALELERIKLQQIQAQGDANKAGAASGMSTGAKIAIWIGGILVVGTVAWLVYRNMKKGK